MSRSAPASAEVVGPLLEVAGRARDRAGPRPAWSRRAWMVAVVTAVAVAAIEATVGRGDVINVGGAGLAERFFAAALRPELGLDFLLLTAGAALTTLAYAVLGTGLSLAIGLVGGVLTSQTWWRPARRGGGAAGRAWAIPWLGSRLALAVPRGVHEVIWGLVLLAVLGLDPWVAVLAIGIPYGAVTAKVFSEIIDETSRQPYEALCAGGARRPAALAYGLFPGALPELLSYCFYRFECAIRAAAILGLVGAGGLGFELLLSFQSLRYEQMWTLLYALVALSGAADAWSTMVRRRRARTATAAARGPATLAPPPRDRLLSWSLLAGLALLVGSAWWLGLSPARLTSGRTLELLQELVARALPPQLGANGLGALVALGWDTLVMSILAGAIAFAGGLVLSVAAADLSHLMRAPKGLARRVLRRMVMIAARTGLLLMRAIPPPVWALVALFVLFPGIWPGALALGIYNLGVVGRLMAESAENLDARPPRALQAGGSGGLRVFAYGIAPAAIGRFVSYGLYRWEVAIRETIVVGAVGAGGLGVLLRGQLDAFAYATALTTVLVVIALCLAVDLISAAIRRSLA